MLRLGRSLPTTGEGEFAEYRVAPHQLVTHGVVTGMTGSGKTGLLFVLVEEALRANVPVLMVDVKGDLTNLLLAFAPGNPQLLEPWLDSPSTAVDPAVAKLEAAELCASRDSGLAKANVTAEDIERYRERTCFRMLMPGSTVAEPVHLLSSMEQRSPPPFPLGKTQEKR